MEEIFLSERVRMRKRWRSAVVDGVVFINGVGQ